MFKPRPYTTQFFVLHDDLDLLRVTLPLIYPKRKDRVAIKALLRLFKDRPALCQKAIYRIEVQPTLLRGATCLIEKVPNSELFV